MKKLKTLQRANRTPVPLGTPGFEALTQHQPRSLKHKLLNHLIYSPSRFPNKTPSCNNFPNLYYFNYFYLYFVFNQKFLIFLLFLILLIFLYFYIFIFLYFDIMQF